MTVSAVLDAAETGSLINQLPQRYGASVQDALLAAVAQSIREWTGATAALLEVEGHGRDGLVDGLDLSRTVGWFTSLYPLLLELDGPTDAERALLSAKEQLRAVPRQGAGFGLLRHLGPEALRASLGALPRPQVSFLYAGRVDTVLADTSPFRAAAEPRGTLRHPADRRPHVLEVQAHAAGGRLHVAMTYSSQLHEARTIEAVLARAVETLRRIAAAARTPGAVLTPSDVPAARLGQRDLDRLLGRLNRAQEERA